MTGAALAFRDVRARYAPADRLVLDDVSFDVAPGERVALLGLNGSGKTTLLLAAVGLVPFEGEIRIDGTPLDTGSAAGLRERIGFLFNVPEDQLLFPRVLDDVAFGLLRRGVRPDQAAERARRALASVGAEDLSESAVFRLSHGQKQRVALAGALVARAPLLLLDEPTAGLDPPGRRDLARLLRDIDAAMLVATHDLEFARDVCTRFLHLEGGRLGEGNPESDPGRVHDSVLR